MSFTIETPKRLSRRELEPAAILTATGFGRDADEHNYLDTQEHLESADHLQFVRDNGELVGFAAYKRLLWQPGS
jgi:hypothetical protein